MKVIIEYDLSNEDDKIDYQHHLQANKYARFIDDLFMDLRTADKNGGYLAIGIDSSEIDTDENKLALLSSFVTQYREYLNKLYNELGINEVDD